jgi:phage baseplate assembly protein W
MPQGLSPKFPMSFSEQGDFSNNETVKQMVKQNFKSLLLTVPGERIMIPDLGVGIKKYLFEHKGVGIFESISGAVKNQTKKYMPYIDIIDIDIRSDSTSEEIVYIKIVYLIKPVGQEDAIEISAI